MWRILVALALGLGEISSQAAEPLAVQPRKVPAVPQDVLLPAGAVRRFGDARFRHPGGISASALSPDGKRLATAADHSVVLWDTATGTALHRFETGRGLPRLAANRGAQQVERAAPAYDHPSLPTRSPRQHQARDRHSVQVLAHRRTPPLHPRT